MLQPVAVEIYFYSGDHEVFFAFKDKAAVHAFLGKGGALSMHYKARRMPLLSKRPPLLVKNYSGKAMLTEHNRDPEKVTDKWRARTISNFEYLMVLNLLAGGSGINNRSVRPMPPFTTHRSPTHITSTHNSY